jgi:hypothetical protein
MSGLMKDWELPIGGAMWTRRKLGKKLTDPGDGGMQKGAPGFTKFQKPSQPQAKVNVSTPLGG